MKRAEAKTLGLRTYNNGKACRSHRNEQYGCERFTNTGGCVRKRKEWTKSPAGIASAKRKRKKYALTERGKKLKRERQRAYYKTEKGKESHKRYSHIAQGMSPVSTIPYPANGGCNICEKTSADGKALARDHDHNTGKDRGWLCSSCNIGLGIFKDDIDLLRKAIVYLMKE